MTVVVDARTHCISLAQLQIRNSASLLLVERYKHTLAGAFHSFFSSFHRCLNSSGRS